MQRGRKTNRRGPLRDKRRESQWLSPLRRNFILQITDYSMFAAEPEREGVWLQEPARRPGNWRRAAVGVLVAGLFFALGATVGKESVDRWIAYLRGWTLSQIATASAPKVTPPAPPDQNTAATDDKSEDRPDAKGADAESHGGVAGGGNLTSEPGAGSVSSGKAGSEDKGDIEE